MNCLGSPWHVIQVCLVTAWAAGCHEVRHEHGGPREECPRAVEHDQTPPEAHAIVRDDPGALGTALFLIPAPEEGVDKYAVRYATDVTYAECARRASISPAFSFVPNKLRKPPELFGNAGICGSADCRPGIRCGPPCLCAPPGLCVTPSFRERG